MSGSFSIDWTKLFEVIKVSHGKPGYLDCKNELICSNCVEKRKMSCFNCEMERACTSCLELVRHKKT